MIDYALNLSNINELVSNHFSLDEESQKKFSETILLGTAADEDITNKLDENFRIERNLSLSDLEGLDISWKLFKYHFGEYCFDTQITYSEFLLNNKVNQKNTSKLSKDVKRYYTENDTAYFLRNNDFDLQAQLETINNYRLPRKKLKMVLSFNLSDMFMCSSGQDWTSCLNLESDYFGCYWLGVASIPFDRNRCMVYLAPQNQKEEISVFDISVERMFKRTFGLLDNEGRINILKWYPTGFEGDYYLTALNRFFPFFSFQEINEEFIPKHELKLPSLKKTKKGEEISFYIYQDKTFISEDGDLKYTYDKGNQHFSSYNGSSFGPFIHCTGGLKRIKKLDSEVINFVGRHVTCYRCEEIVHEDDILVYNDYPHCLCCYDEITYEEEEAY